MPKVSGSGPADHPDDDPDDDPASQPPGPFQGVPFLGDLARLLQQQGPLSWDAARQLAMSIATGGTSEPNVDPMERMRAEQLARVAELQVGSVTDLPPSRSGSVRVVPVNRAQWVQRSIDGYRPLFERLASSLSGARESEPDAGDLDSWFGGLLQALGPMMLGMTAGGMVGHLARRSFGQYDLPIPRAANDELLLCIPNLDEFADAWTLPADDLRLWVCLHEIATHSVLSLPHVAARLDALLHEYAGGFDTSGGAIGDRLADLDTQDITSIQQLQEMFGDPEVLLGAVQTDAQREVRRRLDSLVAVLVGYVDHVMDTIGTNLIASYGMLTEAVRRRRVEADPSDRFVGRLLGLELTQPAYDRGTSFVSGVIERAGGEGLRRLWRVESELPTPSEVDAPGLWLARIDLPVE